MRRAVLAVVAVLAAVPCAGLDIPPLQGRVNDLAGLYSSAEAAAMQASLEKLDRETGAQVVVLTIPSLEGGSLEDYSIRVVEAWKLGEADRDNGVLVLIARDDRRIRIEVGYGLEGVLPDALCGRIIDQAMRPAFRRGDFAGGTLEAIEVIAAAIQGDPEASARLEDRPPEAGEIQSILVTGVIFLLVIGTFAVSALFSKGPGAWFIYLFLTPFFFGFPAAVLGSKAGLVAATGWLIGYPILRLLLWKTPAGRDFRRSHPTWTTWGSSGGSWSRGGGFGGGGFGGFSGGGGSFGGGGASGGW